jgi:hypothetical protein
MAEKLMRMQIDAPVVAVAEIEVSVDHHDLIVLQSAAARAV